VKKYSFGVLAKLREVSREMNRSAYQYFFNADVV
jgi:hypothetical protein